MASFLVCFFCLVALFVWLVVLLFVLFAFLVFVCLSLGGLPHTWPGTLLSEGP